MTDTPRARSITFFHADDAPSLEDDGMMSAPDIPEEVSTTLNLRPLLAGSVSRSRVCEAFGP